MPKLSNRKIAILTESGFEEVELTSPLQALQEAGATVQVVSPQQGTVRGMKDHNWSIEVPVDLNIAQANPNNFDGLLLPGGVFNPDQLRQNQQARFKIEKGDDLKMIKFKGQQLEHTHFPKVVESLLKKMKSL